MRVFLDRTHKGTHIAPDPPVKLRILRTKTPQRRTMIHPQHRSRGKTTQPEEKRPGFPENPRLVLRILRQPGTVKCDVARLVPNDERAHLLQRQIRAVFPQHFVINMAHDFGEQQRVELEIEPKPLSHPAKKRKAPVARDRLPAQSLKHTTQQTRMFPLFRKPQVNELF